MPSKTNAMKTTICLILLSVFVSTNSYSQWSVGARFGGTAGVSLKSYPRSGSTLFEAIGGFNLDEDVEGFALTMMVEKFGGFDSSNRFGAILGLGETMIFKDEFHLGLSGIIGFDWRLTRRIGVQLDWLPTWIFVPESTFSTINVAFTARWLFAGRATPTY
jgi:hypothetical protein